MPQRDVCKKIYFPCPIKICWGGYCRTALFYSSTLRPARTPDVSSSVYPVLASIPPFFPDLFRSGDGASTNLIPAPGAPT